MLTQVFVERAPNQAQPGPIVRLKVYEVGAHETHIDMTPGQTRQLIADLQQALATPEKPPRIIGSSGIPGVAQAEMLPPDTPERTES
jgi:hypothetical protein